MQRRPAALALLLLAAASCAGNGGAPDRSVAEAEVRRANAAYDRAVVTADAAALNEILARDYSYVTADGEVRDKVTQIANLTSGRFQIMSAGSEQVTVRWIGDDALLIGRFPARVRQGERETRIDERYSALWSREDGRWRLRHEHASLIVDAR